MSTEEMEYSHGSMESDVLEKCQNEAWQNPVLCLPSASPLASASECYFSLFTHFTVTVTVRHAIPGQRRDETQNKASPRHKAWNNKQAGLRRERRAKHIKSRFGSSQLLQASWHYRLCAHSESRIHACSRTLRRVPLNASDWVFRGCDREKRSWASIDHHSRGAGMLGALTGKVNRRILAIWFGYILVGQLKARWEGIPHRRNSR